MSHCKYCGKEVKKKKKYCDKYCYYLFLKDPTNNPMYGKKQTCDTKNKISSSRLKIYYKFCAVCGKELKSRQKKYCSQSCRSKGVTGANNHFYGKKHKLETIENNRKKHIGKKASQETRKKMRVSAIEHRKSLISGWHPNYNKKACAFFRQFDKENSTRGQHAENGGEYHIEDLGYYLDYINFEKKLIIEFDEKGHYCNGQLKNEDRVREKEIREHFPDFEFKRIHEKEALRPLFKLNCP